MAREEREDEDKDEGQPLMAREEREDEDKDEGLTIRCTPWLLRLGAWSVVFITFILSAVAVNSCRFIRAEVIEYGGGIGNPIKDPTTEILVSSYPFGLFRFEYDDTCVSYGEVVGDLLGFQGAFKTARAMGVLSSLLGGISMTIVLASFFVRIPWTLWKAAGIVLFPPCAILQGLTFAAFSTSLCDPEYYESGVSVTCKVDEGGKVAIAAIFMYILAGGAMFLVPAPDRPIIKFEMVGAETSTKSEGEPTETPQPEPAVASASAVAERSTAGSKNSALSNGEHAKSEHDVASDVDETFSRGSTSSHNSFHDVGYAEPGSETAVASLPRNDEGEQYITTAVNSDGSQTLVVQNGLPTGEGHDSPVSSEV